MKLKLLQVLIIAYFLLLLIFLKTFNIYSIIFLIIVFLIDYFTNIKSGIKNLLYFLAALSPFSTLFGIFLVYLPFAVLGVLFTKRSFTKNYILGFAISFIPVNIIYLITTYFSLSLNYFIILIIFYLIPLIAIFLLKEKSVKLLEIDNKEGIFLLIVLLSTVIIATNIVNDEALFMANGVRIFSRVQFALDGLNTDGAFPIYNPGIAQGEPTSLWDTPSFKTHVALASYILRSNSPILFFNAQSLFILFLSTVALGVLFWSVIDWKKSTVSMLAVTATAIIIGLNFYFLKILESFKAGYTYPLAYLFLSLILDNPKKFNEFLILMFLSVILVTTHLPYASGVLFIGASLFLITKMYFVKDNSELKEFFKWLMKNKLIVAVSIVTISLMPIFYLSAGFIFNDFLDRETVESKITLDSLKSDSANFLKGFFFDTIPSALSLKYPDANRIDDHRIGFFISIFGPISFFLSLLLYRSKSTYKFRQFILGFLLGIVIPSFFYSKISIYVGGFFRTSQPYLLILLGASIIALICFFKNKYVKYALIVMVFLAFIHSVPYAKQNITNIHREYFASGNIYSQEIDFIKKLPIDGRILTYGLFNNVIDFGGNILTGRYFSRNERNEFNIERNLFEKIHGQHSFGDPDVVLSKSGTELSNYLKLGGWKYLFMDACHPTGNYIVSILYPDFTYPIYQNNCLLFLAVNNTNYIEKVDLVKKIPDEMYNQKEGYKYITVSPFYKSDMSLNFKEKPKDPEPLKFQRLSYTEVAISGNFENGDFVVFKEQYFPRWKAYMNNKEVPVLSTLHELILIKTDKGDNVLLKYIILPIEKIFGTLSLIAHIVWIIILIYLLRI